MPYPFDREADVIGQRDQLRLAELQPELAMGLLEDLPREDEVLRRDLHQEGLELLDIVLLVGDEDLDDLRLVHHVARLALEAQPTTGEHQLAALRMAREDDVVVEDLDDLHAHLLDRPVSVYW